MVEDKLVVLHPEEIPDQPFPQEELASYDISQLTTGGTYSPQSIKDQPLPRKIIAHETIGSALNTKSRKILAEFQFTESGALQIGKYTNGISGDLRISPNGITARNLSGITTFAINGDTGDATFLGTIQAGTVIADDVLTDYLQVGGAATDINDNVTTIDGGKITTNSLDANTIKASSIDVALDVGNGNVLIDGANKRIIINDGTNDRILIGYSVGGF